MSDLALMERAILALRTLANLAKIDVDAVPSLRVLVEDLSIRIEVIKEEEKFYKIPKEMRDRQKIAIRAKVHHLLDSDLTLKYEECKKYFSNGMRLKDACEKAGITRDQWYRRRNMEKYGASKRRSI